MFKDMKIGMRLGLGFAFMFVLMAGLTFFGLNNMKTIEENIERILKVNNFRQQLANEMVDIVREDAIAMRNVFLQKDRTQEMKERMDKNNIRYQEALKKIEELTTKTDTEGLEAITKVKNAREVQKKLDEKTMELVRAQKFDEAFNEYIKEARASMRDSIEAVNALIIHQEKRSQKRYEDTVKSYNDARIYMLSFAGCCSGARRIAGFFHYPQYHQAFLQRAGSSKQDDCRRSDRRC